MERAKESGKEFMLKEYDRLFNLMLNELEESNQRARFFITIIVAVLSAIGLALKAEIPIYEEVIFALILILASLTVVGILTLNRIFARNVQNKIYSKLMLEIQRYFRNLDPEIEDYLELKEKLIEQANTKTNANSIPGEFRSLLQGTLSNFVIFGNAFLIGGITFLVLYKLSLENQMITVYVILFYTVLFAISSIFLFIAYTSWIRKKIPPFSTKI